MNPTSSPGPFIRSPPEHSVVKSGRFVVSFAGGLVAVFPTRQPRFHSARRHRIDYLALKRETHGANLARRCWQPVDRDGIRAQDSCS